MTQSPPREEGCLRRRQLCTTKPKQTRSVLTVGAGFSRSRAPKAPLLGKMPLRGKRPAKAGAYGFLHVPLCKAAVGADGVVAQGKGDIESDHPVRSIKGGSAPFC